MAGKIIAYFKNEAEDDLTIEMYEANNLVRTKISNTTKNIVNELTLSPAEFDRLFEIMGTFLND